MDTGERLNPMVWHGEEAPTGVFLDQSTDGLTLVGMPSLLARRRPRVAFDAKATPAVLAILNDLLAALKDDRLRPHAIDITNLSSDERDLIGDVIGDGDVSIVAGRAPLYQVQEATLTGVWRVRALDETGAVVTDRIEVGDIATVVRETARTFAYPSPVMPVRLPQGVMNALPVFAEIADRSADWKPGQENHILNFTLLPMTPEDTAFLTGLLGQIPLSIVSSGYGTCRIIGTGLKNVWGVQYLNASGQVILDTVEIGDVPPAAMAGAEDFEDSAVRLTEIMEAYL
ncbi:MAG: hydrogenase expression/formation C-terminal domain-containing protein [Labrys sp. (in: a-proteobacteria)]